MTDETKNASSENNESSHGSAFSGETRNGFTPGTIADLPISVVQNMTFTTVIFNDGTEVQQVTFNDTANRINDPTNEKKN